MIFAGEVFPAKHLSQLMALLPHSRHLNWYGPTETNVCTWYEVPRGTTSLAAPVPLGSACANMGVLRSPRRARGFPRPGRRASCSCAVPG